MVYVIFDAASLFDAAVGMLCLILFLAYGIHLHFCICFIVVLRSEMLSRVGVDFLLFRIFESVSLGDLSIC